MYFTDPTDAQHAFIQNPSAGKILFGSRQIGKTTGLALDTIEKGLNSRNSGPIGVTAPTMDQGRRLLDRCREVAQEQIGDQNLDTSNLAEFVLPNGISIQYVPISDLYMNEKSMGVSRIDEFEYLTIDEVDFISQDAIDQIVSDWEDREVRGLAFAGTAKTDSPNIEDLVKSNQWFSVYDTLSNSNWVHADDVNEMMNTVAPEQGATEYKGLFVSDPADDASFVAGEYTE